MCVGVKRWGVVLAVRAVLTNRHVATLAALNACVRDTVAQACTVQGGCVFCRAVQQRGKDRHLMTVGAHTKTSRCVPLTWTFTVIVTTWTTERDRWRKWSENISFYYVSVIKKKKTCFLLSGISLKDFLAMIMTVNISESAWMWPGSTLRVTGSQVYQ